MAALNAKDFRSSEEGSRRLRAFPDGGDMIQSSTLQILFEYEGGRWSNYPLHLRVIA